jgi:hypothetical protein
MTKRFAVLAAMSFSGMAMATDVYTTQSEFLSNTAPGFYLEDFTSAPNGFVQFLSFGPVNGFGYSIVSDFDGGLFNSAGVVSTNFSDEKLVINFTGAEVTAVGGNFWCTDEFFTVIPSKITIELSDGTTVAYDSAAITDFRGFTSDTPITQITIDADDPDPTNLIFAWPTLDNLYVGTKGGGTPACYPDCDLSGSLNIDDFICFQTFFALSDPSADCDLSGTLNIDDFICFQTFFALGC